MVKGQNGREWTDDDIVSEAFPDGTALLDQVLSALLRYVVFPTSEAAYATTLWIAATHVQPAWEHAPRLVVASPEKRCGKSRLLDLVEALAHNALVTVNISPAALVRSITEDDPPTLCLDEADTIFGPKAADNNEDLRGIINSGHQRNRPYIRWDITRREPEKCPTFAMAVLAGIGEMPDTIMDRAVVIRMRRRAPGENVLPYRTRRDRPALDGLRDRLHEWLRGSLDHLQDAEPEMPVEDRAADTWEPLIAVADLAGGAWPQRARSAVLALVGAEDAAEIEASMGVRLLGDIRDTFEEWTVSFRTSQELVNDLMKIEEAPWRDMGLTTRRLSDLLRPYGIKPTRNTAGSARGYRVEDMAEAFSRYLASTRPEPSNRPNSRSETGGLQGPDTSNRQDAETVYALTRELDGLTVPDGTPSPMSEWAATAYDREA